MPARFDDLVPYFGDTVIAIGPLHPSEKLKEVCAWVYQPTEDRANDAAATEMTTNLPDQAHPHEHFQQVDGTRWLLPMMRISDASFVPGQAFAVAVALVVDLTAPNNERVVWWGQPVDLFESEAHVEAAHNAGALERPPLRDPAPFPIAV